MPGRDLGSARRCARRTAAVLAAVVLLGTAAAQASGLQPFQMTRSLQLAQDRIADGDHAALPMQRRLIEMIDERLRRADGSEFDDERNFNALLIYGMSGGNPSTFEAALSRLELEEGRRALAYGVRDYLVGNVAGARAAFQDVELDGLPPDLAAYTALVKGSVLAGTEPEKALEMLDHARLLSPGTLVEEAALRRSMPLHVASGDVDRFLLAASQYVRRFLRSPYASQYAQSFVAGTAQHYDRIDRRAIGDILDWMSKDQAQTIYLRLARQAAIDGHDSMLAYASAKARKISGQSQDGEDVRSVLYSTIASVTSDTVDEVLHKLGQIDRDRLSSDDRALLDAARSIASEVVARPSDSASIPDDEIEVVAQDAASAPQTATLPEPEEVGSGTDALVTSAREKLEAIDRMLENAEQ
jgi:chemotaxis protein MotC